MIVITGAAGFIGSGLVSKLNAMGYKDLVVADDFSRKLKNLNLAGKAIHQRIHRDLLLDWLRENHRRVSFVFHLGARTDTTEFNKAILDKLNLNYSKELWQACVKYHLPMVYASSAATYGGGELGYEDDHQLVEQLRPLNPYGESKNEFDKWVLKQTTTPPYWAGLKFFNVFGPNEYHKGRMASVVFHTYQQIRENGRMQLFRSHHPDYRDGEQLRDFIYVKDVVDVCFFLMLHKNHPGIYNLGTGQARSFNDLAAATFQALDLTPKIDYIDTPEDIRDKYQYFTQAPMDKLREAGYYTPFYTLEEGVMDYVKYYLIPERTF